MLKNVQLLPKTKWLRTIFVLILSSIFNISIFAGNTYTLTDTTISFSYNSYSSDIDEDKIPDYWQGTLEDVFSPATGDNAWTPINSEKFSITLTGTADFSGNVKVYMVDTRADVGYWTQLSQNYLSFDVVNGETFSTTFTFTITNTSFNGYTLLPNMVFEALPTTTSTKEGFDNTKKFSLTFDEFDITYIPLTTTLSYHIYNADTDGDEISDYWRGTFDDIFSQATGNDAWTPNIGEKFTITLSGTADFNGNIKVYMADTREEVVYWKTLCDNFLSFDVVKGETFSTTFTFTITNTDFNGYTLLPNMIFDALPTITSTKEDFDNTKKYSLTFDTFRIKYTPRTTCTLSYNTYSSDIDEDKIPDYWQGTLEDVFSQATGDDSWEPSYGEHFSVTLTGTADFSGNVKVYMVDTRADVGYWTQLCQDVFSFDVVEGEEFSQAMEFTIDRTKYNGYTLLPNMVFEALPTTTSTKEGFDNTKEFSFTFNKFDITYTPKPEINSEDYSTSIELTKYNYGSADINGDGKDDSWYSEYGPSQIIQNQGYHMSDVADGDKLIVHFNGIADFTGKLSVYIIDDTDWHMCSSVIEHAIEYGKIFEINDTLVIKDASQHITIRMDAECDDTLYPKYKYLYSNDFAVSYSSQFCKVVVNCKDVTSVYSLWSSEKKAFDIDAYSRIQIENLDKQYILPENFNVVFTLPKGSQVTIKANPNHDGDFDEEFYSWNDGSNDTIKTFTVPNTDSLVLTANFRDVEQIYSYSAIQVIMKALDTVTIYLPKYSHSLSTYGSTHTYTIEHEDSLVVTKLSNDTLYFMPPVEAIGKELDMKIRVSILNGKSGIINFVSATSDTCTMKTIQRDSLFPTPKISLVTVSQETGKNLVVWQKFETDKIDHYNIYRESEVAGEYKKIAEVPYSETSIYEDTDADPLVRAWRYKISASPVDTRYTESDQSIAHKTIHLTKNLGMNNAYNLIWDNYEGMDFSTFVVIRNYKVGTNVVTDTIAEIPSNVNSYTDLEPQKRTISYYVAIKLNEPVDPNEYLKSESGPFSLALSNIAEIENSEESTRINDIESDVIVYAIQNTIYVKNATAQAKVYNIESELVAQSQSNSGIQEITIEKVGVYFVKVANSLYKVIIF